MPAGDKMDLYAALDIDLNKDELLCFVGAGGKTTAMFSLAKELRKHAKKVLVTTTTALFYPDERTATR
jgi:signal recognition particle GTPase